MDNSSNNIEWEDTIPTDKELEEFLEDENEDLIVLSKYKDWVIDLMISDDEIGIISIHNNLLFDLQDEFNLDFGDLHDAFCYEIKIELKKLSYKLEPAVQECKKFMEIYMKKVLPILNQFPIYNKTM